MSRLEKSEEIKFVKMVRGNGWKCVKLSTAGPYGERGWNDRLVLAPYRVVVFFEFKRSDGKVSKIQSNLHKDILEMGHPTYVVYTAEEAWRKLKDHLHPKTLSAGLYKIRLETQKRRMATRSRTRQDRHRTVRVQDLEEVGSSR